MGNTSTEIYTSVKDKYYEVLRKKVSVNKFQEYKFDSSELSKDLASSSFKNTLKLSIKIMGKLNRGASMRWLMNY